MKLLAALLVGAGAHIALSAPVIQQHLARIGREYVDQQLGRF